MQTKLLQFVRLVTELPYSALCVVAFFFFDWQADSLFLSLFCSTAQRVRQIPCRKGTMIKKLYEEIVKSQQRAKAVLELEKITEWIGVSDDS